MSKNKSPLDDAVNAMQTLRSFKTSPMEKTNAVALMSMIAGELANDMARNSETIGRSTSNRLELSSKLKGQARIVFEDTTLATDKGLNEAMVATVQAMSTMISRM